MPTPSPAAPSVPAVVPRCAECVAELTGSRSKLFCSPSHKIAFRNRAKIRGQTAAPFLMAAALARHAPSDAGRYATRQMWALAAKWNREDRAAARMSATEFAAIRMAAKWEACDLG